MPIPLLCSFSFLPPYLLSSARVLHSFTAISRSNQNDSISHRHGVCSTCSSCQNRGGSITGSEAVTSTRTGKIRCVSCSVAINGMPRVTLPCSCTVILVDVMQCLRTTVHRTPRSWTVCLGDSGDRKFWLQFWVAARGNLGNRNGSR